MNENIEKKIDYKRLAIRNAVRSVLQQEVAREIWYESRFNEERLGKLLENAEEKLTDYILTTFLA